MIHQAKGKHNMIKMKSCDIKVWLKILGSTLKIFDEGVPFS